MQPEFIYHNSENVQNVRCKLRIERKRHNYLLIFLSCGGNRLVQTDVCTVSLKNPVTMDTIEL